MAPTAPDSGWTQAVRQRLGLGRLLPLGGAADGCWLAERAADTVLRRAAQDVAGVRLGSLRVGPADPDGAHGPPAVPPPPGALPCGPLRIEAECEASHRQPIPYATSRLRAALAAAADARLGLTVTEVDLRVTGLLDDTGRDDTRGDGPEDVPERTYPNHPFERPADEAGAGTGTGTGSGTGTGTGNGAGGTAPADPEELAARAATGVPGVVRLTSVLGVPVHHDTAPTGPHVRVEVAVTGERRAREVALAVRAAVAEAVPGRPSVAVLVTEVGS